MNDTVCHNESSEPLLPVKGDGFVENHHKPRTLHVIVGHILVLLLLPSLAINGYLLRRPPTPCSSPYASLESNPRPFEWSSEYADTNLTAAGVLWDNISFDAGVVALEYDWTAAHGLPHAQPFPWDQSKGLYLLNGFHALHCLKNIHRAVREYELDMPQSLPLMHITHCLDSLRDDILCQADDTPRFTTRTKAPESGMGQLRQCKDWGALEKWAAERTACYRYVSHKAGSIDQFELFKYCPKDSPYWPALRKHFGKPDNWFGEGCTKGVLGVEC